MDEQAGPSHPILDIVDLAFQDHLLSEPQFVAQSFQAPPLSPFPDDRYAPIRKLRRQIRKGLEQQIKAFFRRETPHCNDECLTCRGRWRQLSQCIRDYLNPSVAVLL